MNTMVPIVTLLVGLAVGIGFGFVLANWIIRRRLVRTFWKQWRDVDRELSHISETIPPGTGTYRQTQYYRDGIEFGLLALGEEV